MGFGDWLSRTFGGDQPPAVELPQPPGEPEIRAALEQVETMLADAKASPLVRSRVARIDRSIRTILPRLAQLGVGSEDAYAVVATATNYLPESVGAYLRLPRDWADSRPIDGGRTALMVLVDQLELLGTTMDRMLDAAMRADANALIAQGRFLDAKFGRVTPTPTVPTVRTADGSGGSGAAGNTLDLG